jgi:MOSC domain-containing protein YiiM
MPHHQAGDPGEEVGRVLFVNTGMPRTLPHGGGTVRTGIWKSPVRGPVTLTPAGFEGDGQADLSVHGGPHMAAYVYPAEDYAWWQARLGKPLLPGTFGENLTVTGAVGDDEVWCGDRFRVGGALVEATGPRIPCFKLGLRMGDKRFVPLFRDTARLGFYVRVLEPGPVTARDAVVRVARGPGAVTVAELARLHISARDDLAGMRAALRAADRLHPRWLAWISGRIAELSGPA